MLRKNLLLLYLLLLATLVIIIGCDKMKDKAKEDIAPEVAAFNPESVRPAIEEKNAVFAKAMVSGDTTALVSHYTDDGRILPPNGEAVVGKSEIAKLFSGYAKMKMAEFKVETVLLYGNEDNLIEEGKFFIGDGKGNTIDKGKYICIWRKVGEEWKCYTDIWNSNIPLPPPPPPAVKK
ncbi:hypothetical protein FLJC2902T_19120 [Flavobacterium limnosediminis JC2902]|uniref:DUF4440 domain-containing protein n=1 Tax=Flavobacterium limnosediminis JC2902 TaxID=1341181 RepID=V6SQ01_9FLAO|nr:DUF4440 domain-containing protein [Flavobacterium limnosediminis]ESU28539.1 hypothetical protein FLJC2902T_19120 [Flavobacterium limnosediminis JC2902]